MEMPVNGFKRRIATTEVAYGTWVGVVAIDGRGAPLRGVWMATGSDVGMMGSRAREWLAGVGGARAPAAKPADAC